MNNTINMITNQPIAEPTPIDFRANEALNSSAIIIIESIGAVLIIGFIIFYAIKKRSKVKSVP